MWWHGYRLPPTWALVVLVGVAMLAERQSVRISDRTWVSVSFLPLTFSAVAFGPLGGFAVGALSNLWDLRESRLKWAVYTPIRGLTAGAAGLAAWTLVPGATDFGRYLLASFVAAVVGLVCEGVLVIATARVRGVDLREVLQAMTSVFLLTVPLYVPILTLFVYGYHAYSLRLVLVFFIPTLAAQRLLHLYQEEKDATSRLATANASLRKANVQFATGLVSMLEAADPYTAGHSAAVAIYARDIAARMGLSEEERDLVHLCGLVHDVGKYRLPASLLAKQGALTLAERREMQRHPEYGEEILRRIDDYGEIAEVVRHHHERIDGQGYPDGLQDSEIPVLSKIIAVADAYNAMTSDRPYREALPSSVARLRLAQAVGSQFDITVVAAFEAILAVADEGYRVGVGEAFQLDRAEADPGHEAASAVVV